jgi:hypothetical protein
LETSYNCGIPFPKALRELLFLAGQYCYVLAYGRHDNQEQMQSHMRKEIAKGNRIILRPFYVIDVYSDGDTFLFVYLDEGDNPNVQNAEISDIYNSGWITNLNITLKDFISNSVETVKQGYNPF